MVTLKIAASKILSDFFQAPKSSDSDTVKVNLIKTAARTTSIMRWSPITSAQGRRILSLLPKKKKSSIHSSITSSFPENQKCKHHGRKHFSPPLQLGLAVQLHHQFASQFLLDTLFQAIRCNCSAGCSSNRCTCKTRGLTCSVACGNCTGVICANTPMVTLEEIMEED